MVDLESVEVVGVVEVATPEDEGVVKTPLPAKVPATTPSLGFFCRSRCLSFTYKV